MADDVDFPGRATVPADTDATRLPESVRTWVLLSAVVALGSGLFVLAAWQFANGEERFGLGFVVMKANTAFGFILLGTGLCGRLIGRSAGHVLSALAGSTLVVLGAATLAEYLLDRDFGIDSLLIGRDTTGVFLRMSVLSAFNFCVLGAALTVNDARRARMIQLLAVLCMVVCLLAFAASAYNAKILYSYGHYTLMTPALAACFSISALGIMASAPGSLLLKMLHADDAGSVLMRRMLPVLIGVSLLLGWLQLRGQQAGLYDAQLGTALLVVALVGVLGATTVRITGELNAKDANLRRASRHAETHGAALALYNRGLSRHEIIDGLLQLLARHHACGYAAFYRYDEWQDRYVREASRDVPDELPTEIRPEEVSTSGMSPAVAAGKVVVVPVKHQHARLGLLLLAAPEPADDGDPGFLDRITTQFALALHNLRQYEDMKLLMQRLRERSEEIVEKNRQLEDASRLKSEFLANMSHELRTPLNAIIGFSEALRDGLVGSLDARQQACVSDIHDSGHHLLSLINDVLDLSKIEAGHMTLEREPVDVRNLLERSVTIVREKAMARRLTVQLDVPEDLPVPSVDARKTRQIVYNLLSNAVKFTPDSGFIHVTAKIADGADILHPDIHMHSGEPRAATRYLGILVRDDGIGIAREDLQRLFQPFMQVDSSMTRRYGGTGLGLAMVNRLTALHDGIVTVQSNPGMGSCFGVWLPLVTATPEVARTTVARAPAVRDPAEPPLALIVEDDSRSAGTLRLFLQEEGFRTLVARDGASALQLAMEHHFDLITLDLILPGMDGWQTLTRLKSLPADTWPANGNTPVLIVSIIGDESMQKGIALGACAVLQKPLHRRDLLETLETVGLRSQAALSVLVVDDDPKAVELLHTFMQDLPGFEVHSAYSGRDGIALAQKVLPDLLILDLTMPEVSGFDVVLALQRDSNAREVPIIVLTGRDLSAGERKQLEGNVQQVLRKADFNRTTFLYEVRRALRGRAAPRIRPGA